MTLYLPIWHSHCTRVRFTVLVPCSDELAVHSYPLLCLQRQVAKLASGFFCCWSSLRNNNMATYLQRVASCYGNGHFAACNCWKQTFVAACLFSLNEPSLFWNYRNNFKTNLFIMPFKLIKNIRKRNIGRRFYTISDIWPKCLWPKQWENPVGR